MPLGSSSLIAAEDRRIYTTRTFQPSGTVKDTSPTHHDKLSKWTWFYPPSTPHFTSAAHLPHPSPSRARLLGVHWHHTKHALGSAFDVTGCIWSSPPFWARNATGDRKELVSGPRDSNRWFCQNPRLVTNMGRASRQNKNHYDGKSHFYMPGLRSRMDNE